MITVETDAEFVPDEIDGRAFLIVYEIHGTEDGTQAFSIESDVDGTYTYDQEFVGTATCDAPLTAGVTTVRERT